MYWKLRFYYKNRDYSGKTLYLSKNVGDEVVILFIETDPSKNEVKEGLESTYGIFLRMNPNLKNDVLKWFYQVVKFDWFDYGTRM